MHESTSSSLLRNRRSSSVISQQVSKRSSISTCNLNIQSHINNNFHILQGGKVSNHSNGRQVLTSNSINSNININNNQGQNNNHKHINNNYNNNINQKQQPTHSFINRQSQPFVTTSSSTITLSTIQQSLVKIKKVTIQSYRPVKKHVKQNMFSFNEQQLKQVYQGMSNSLKLIQKLMNAVSVSGQLVGNGNTMNGENNINGSGNSRERYFECTGSNINVNGNSMSMLTNYNNNQHKKSLGQSTIQPLLSNTQQHSINTTTIQHYQQLINKLQLQLQTIKKHHSEYIRQMIQTHQQQIGYVEKEHQKQLQNIQCGHEKIVEKIKMDAEKVNLERQKQIKQIINQYESKINYYQEKINSYQQKLQKLATIEQAKRKQQQHQITILTQNQQKYKTIVKELIQRLNKTKTMYDKLDAQYKEKMKRVVDSIRSSVKSLVKSNNVNSRGLLQIILERLTMLERNSDLEGSTNENNANYHNTNINNIYSNNYNHNTKPQSIPTNHITQFQKSTQAIQQMFQQNNSRNDSQMIITGDNVQKVIERLVCELVMCGFFCQENEDNVMALFNISKQNKLQYDNGVGVGSINNDSNDDGNNMDENGEMGIMGHGLFPLVMEKMKLTIASKYQDLVEQQSIINNNNNPQSSSDKITSNNNNVSQFTTSHYNPTNNRVTHNQPITTQQPQQIYYRNIQSLQQLQVSDSMLCDHEQQPLQQHQNNNIYAYPNEQEQYTDELFRNSRSDGVKSSNNDDSQQNSNYNNDSKGDNIKREQLCYGGYESEDSGSFDIQLF